MGDEPLRLVLDTNVLFAGLLSASSASQKIVSALQSRRAIPLLSTPVISEYRRVLSHPSVTLTFVFERDPRDAMFIELAIAGRATHIVTMDDDILSLPSARTNAGKRFRQRLPGIETTTAQLFVERFPQIAT